MIATYFTLKDGTQLGKVGLGVWQLHGKALTEVMHTALAWGYKHIDCAALYGNEAEVAAAVRSSSVDVSSVRITTKVWNDDVRAGTTMEAIDRSRRELATDRLDICLIHWPVMGLEKAWETLLRAQQDEKVETIGVSNFLPRHLDRLRTVNDHLPAINQFEHHPWLSQKPLLQATLSHEALPVAHTPLMQGNFQQVAALKSIGLRHGKSPAQILLRWNLEQGIAVIPKTSNGHRVKQNIALFDFSLSKEEMLLIAEETTTRRFSGDPTNIDF